MKNIIETLQNRNPVFWTNPDLRNSEMVLKKLELSYEDVLDAERRLMRFAPLIAQLFPETDSVGGVIESELLAIDDFAGQVYKNDEISFPGKFLLKADHALPIAGSIKARGGIYEVLLHAETLALENGLLSVGDNYSKLNSDKARSFFQGRDLAVASTGNLGMSIGIMGAALGFSTTVHMSVEAKAWKKRRLRERGVNVIEHQCDYSDAVTAGREAAATNENSYFVDDENSPSLFLGYSVAAIRLKRQLEEMAMAVDGDHPLFVYLPCGVGGAPGGITFGLKHIFGDNVHAFFSEPMATPCMLLALVNGSDKMISSYDAGLRNDTVADGLAVSVASQFVAKMVENLVSGVFTVSDDELFNYLKRLYKVEGIKIEPSAAPGFPGPELLFNNPNAIRYLRERNLSKKMENATHIIWTTGGLFLPDAEFAKFIL